MRESVKSLLLGLIAGSLISIAITLRQIINLLK